MSLLQKGPYILDFHAPISYTSQLQTNTLMTRGIALRDSLSDLLEDIDEYLSNPFEYEEPRLRLLDDDALICECNCISVEMIRNTCKEPKNLTKNFLKQELKMGVACGKCLKSFDSWKNGIFQN